MKVPKGEGAIPSSIPKELQPSAKEALKYKSAEEFVNSNPISEVELIKKGDAQMVKTMGAENYANRAQLYNQFHEMQRKYSNSSVNKLSDYFSKEEVAKYKQMNGWWNDFVKNERTRLTDLYNKVHGKK